MRPPAADEYKVAFEYTIMSSVFYGIISLAYTSRTLGFRRACVLLWRLLHFRVSGIIGLAWGVNYFAILVAGPYLPNAVQTIFAQARRRRRPRLLLRSLVFRLCVAC